MTFLIQNDSNECVKCESESMWSTNQFCDVYNVNMNQSSLNQCWLIQVMCYLKIISVYDL